MSIFRHIIISAIGLLFINICAFGQTSCKISGSVYDENNTPVSYCSAVIYSEGKPVAGGITDEQGKFSISMSRNGREYILGVEFIGYKKAEMKFTADKAGIDVGRIVLKENAEIIGEAVVSAKTDAVKSTVEHTVINADANMSASKGSALDLLGGSSTVTVMNDGIAIRGNRNILVLMDGAPTTVSDLSTIPAANIKNIEIVTNPDASYDSDGTGGIINIVSKKTIAKGLSGVIAANYGFTNFVTGNIALSYVRGKAAWRLNYNTKFEGDEIHTNLNRVIKSSGDRIFQQIEADKKIFNTNIGIGADFKIDPRNSLSIDVKCILPRNNLKQDLHNTIDKGGITTQENRHNDVTWNRENIEGSIVYRHIIKPEVSDFTVRGSVSKIWGHRPSYYFLEGIQTHKSNSGGSPFISSLQADFKRKFKACTLAAGVKMTYRRNDIYHEFYSFDGSQWAYSDEFSNDLLHNELVPAAYAMFSSRIGKKFTYKAGLRSEAGTVFLSSAHEGLSGWKKHNFFLAPTLSGTYRIAENQDISLAFSRRVGRPAYPQLNPYMSMVDASTYEQGNMYLNPEKASKLDLSYNIKSKHVQFFADLYLNHTLDFISQITKITDGLLITTYINAPSDLKAGVDLSLKVMPCKWMRATLGANTFYTDTKGRFDGAQIDNRGWSNNSNLSLDFMPGKTTDIQLQYFLTTPQYFPQLTTALTHHMNAGVKQRFFKGAMTVSVLLTDVFNTHKWEVRSDNALFDLTNISHHNSRILWLGISYNFNSFKQKKDTAKKENDRSLIRLGL